MFNKRVIMYRKAFALSIVLWIVAALLFAMATLAVFSKDVQDINNGVNDKLLTQLEAHNILEILKFYISTASYNSNSFTNSSFKDLNYMIPDKIIVDNRWYQLNKDTRIRLQDLSALINVFQPSALDISNMATNSSERQLKYVITDSIRDWTDGDNVVRLNGAESASYKLREDVEYINRNTPALQSVEELRLIKGISDLNIKRWNALKKRLYCAKATSKNLSLIDKKYLAYILDIDETEAESFIQVRDNDLLKFINMMRKQKKFDYEEMGFSLSKILTIEIEVLKNAAKSRLKVLIDFDSHESLFITYFYQYQ